MPGGEKDQNDFSAYTLVCAEEGPSKIHLQRDFIIKKSFFPVDEYKAVKALFDSVRQAMRRRSFSRPCKK